MYSGRPQACYELLRQVRPGRAHVSLFNTQPSCDFTDLFIWSGRVCVACSSVKGAQSDTVAFTTLPGAPDAPAAPRLLQRTKSSISLQWRSPNDNGSKITGFCLEYHEGKQSAFKEVYSATLIFILFIVVKVIYSIHCCTASCSAAPPAPPAPPRLTEAGVTWLSLEWSAPCGSAGRDTLVYILEVEEKGLGCGFQLKHRGEEQSCTVKELKRFTSYQFRVLATDTEGTSQPSGVVEYRTLPDQPGNPGKPSLCRPAQPHSLHVIWEAPEDDGGSPITLYVLEISHTDGQWDVVYSGPLRQHVCECLLEGTWYSLRVHCRSLGGQSQILSVETPALPPGPCEALRTAGDATPSEIPLCWGESRLFLRRFTVILCRLALLQSHNRIMDVPCKFQKLFQATTYVAIFNALYNTTAVYVSLQWGPLSEKCQASTAAGPPEQCRAPELTLKTSSSVLASWQVPVCNGAEVCEFRMEWGLEEGSLELLYCGPSSQYEVNDLRPATEYRCRVQAVSDVGAGLFSDVAMVTTPASVPAAVEHVEEMRAEPLDDVMPRSSATTLALRWKEPRCHGAEISSYNIDIGEELPLSVGRTSYHILENLQPETTYRIRVQAVNSIGSGPFSSVLKLRTRGLPPEPPLLECAVAGPQSLKLKWGEGPSRPQNSRGTHYCLHMQVDTDRSVCIYSGPCHTFKVQRLCEATEYQFSIQAHSEAGMGPLSTPYTFSTTRSPPPQLRAPKVEPVEWNKYAVTWETLQPMRGDPIVYNLQLLRGREVEQLYKGPATSYTWQNSTTGVSCRLRVCAGRRSQEGSELWGQCSLSTSLPATAQPREHKISSCQDPLPKRSWPLTDEPFATILLFGFVVLAVLFAVLIQYFVIERQ
uniref:Fibronectin type-III domain-containing protein n=1 Tax=Astyanax mexicanus TaxID=7994 RepID=A0A8B9RJ95_ASTMX